MDENDNEFLKIAYKTGRIKDASEAFEEFPPEEEWHKGRAEYFLKEDSEIYSIYTVGDIVFVKKFIYESGEEEHNHLFVIITQDNLVVPIENFCMLISSKLNKLRYRTNKLLKKNEINGLDKDSVVKTDYMYKIDSKQILFKIGTVDMEKVEEYKEEFLNNII